MQQLPFTPPFHVEDNRIYDAEGRYVTLWGVNYYTPFNHNFYNIRELGKDHGRAIDEDLEHFRLMGVDFLRMHMYEREITDPEGNLVENANLQVFDYLVEQCAKRGIFLMLSPMSYWNTVQNQIAQEQQYAFWNIGSQEAFGFTNFYSIDALLWHPGAIACQERYLAALFAHKNAFSGKTLREYPNLIAWELMNEMQYPDLSLLEEEPPLTAFNMAAGFRSRGPLRRTFQEKFRTFRAEHPEYDGEGSAFSAFRCGIVESYLRKFWGLTDAYFQGNVLNSQFMSYSGAVPEDLKELFAAAPYFNAQSLGTYLNANGFDSVNTDLADHLALAEKWFDRFGEQPGRRPRIAYEFDASCTQNGYPLAAIAAMYAKYGVQMAAYFTYTPAAVAAWNPGWLVHYLNIAHTPSRAAAFIAAGKLFRARQGKDFTREANTWHDGGFVIRRDGDFVLWRDRTSYCHSADCVEPAIDREALTLICGRGASPLVSCDGNGVYLLEKKEEGEWMFTLFPAQRYLTEPARGRAFLSMANRYVNCLRELPVSQLSERVLTVRFPLFKKVRCFSKPAGGEFAAEDGVFRLPPGTYFLNETKDERS